jgi:hypothetical protein
VLILPAHKPNRGVTEFSSKERNIIDKNGWALIGLEEE